MADRSEVLQHSTKPPMQSPSISHIGHDPADLSGLAKNRERGD
jgi:hypothetical protein